MAWCKLTQLWASVLYEHTYRYTHISIHTYTLLYTPTPTFKIRKISALRRISCETMGSPILSCPEPRGTAVSNWLYGTFMTIQSWQYEHTARNKAHRIELWKCIINNTITYCIVVVLGTGTSVVFGIWYNLSGAEYIMINIFWRTKFIFPVSVDVFIWYTISLVLLLMHKCIPISLRNDSCT